MSFEHNRLMIEDIVYIYNYAPHETFTYYAGQPTTPNQADNDPELQQYITYNKGKLYPEKSIETVGKRFFNMTFY